MRAFTTSLLLAQLLSHAPARFDWAKIDERGIELKANAAPVLIRTPYKKGTRLKLEISADSGVFFGLANQPMPNTFNAPITCLNKQVFKASVICTVPTDTSVFFIGDERKSGSDNRVLIVLSVWKCIENCPVLLSKVAIR